MNLSVGSSALLYLDHKIKPFFTFDLTTSYNVYEHGGSAHFDGDGDYLNYEQSTRDTYDADFTTRVGYINIKYGDTQWRTIYYDGQSSSTKCTSR